MINLMQHKIIRTGKNSWVKICITCGHKFETGEDRHEWRMNLKSQIYYHAGGFWTVQCHECFVNTVVLWRDSMNKEIEEMPKCMKELIQ